MKQIICIFIFLMATLPCQSFAEEPVYFADPGLKAAVEEALGVYDPTPGDMLFLLALDAAGRSISDLTGLEYAVNLGLLDLSSNRISDISALSGLAYIWWLDLSSNQIRDISALSAMYYLAYLNLCNNPLNEEAYAIYIPLIYDNNLLLHPVWWPIDYDPPGSCCELIISSTDGGSVAVPGEGTFYYYQGSDVPLMAISEPNCLFVSWAGTAVDAGKVADPCSAITTVVVDANYTLQANFSSSNEPPIAPTLVLPADGATVLTTPTFQLFVSGIGNKRFKFKIEVLQNGAIVQTFDQTQDVTNWDKVEYTSDEIATFTLSENQALNNGNYQWRAYAFDGKQWSTASQTWSFSATVELEQIETAHFIIKYTTNSLIPWHVENNTYAERVAQYMEDAYDFFVEECGFNAGWSEDCEKYKVVIGELYTYLHGAYGALRADALKLGGELLGTYSVIGHNLDNNTLKLTCFHEYFHAIQHAYHRYLNIYFIPYSDANANLWIIEGNARAIEYIAPGYPVDFTDGMGTTSSPSSFEDYIKQTHKSLKSLIYDAALYWYFLMRNTKIEFDGNSQRDISNNIENTSVIKTLWEKLHEFGPNDSWDDEVAERALDAALANAEPSEYGSFDSSFIAFAKANFIAITMPSNSEEQFYQPDAASSIQNYGIRANTLETVDIRTSQVTITRNVENYGVRYFRITGANAGNRLQITFNGDNESSFFTRIYPAGDVNREDTINNWDIVTFPKDDAVNTVVIIGRLSDSHGSGDFTITFSDVSQ
jgi:hypothetical protein